MKLSQELPQGKFFIQRYENGAVTINNEIYTKSLIITPEKIIPDWKPNHFIDLTVEDFDEIVALKPQVFLLGTGKQQQFPNPAILAKLYNQNIGVEIMDTGAACRTFNLLLSENRRVVAALIMN